MDSKDLFNAIKNFQIKFSEAKNKQSEFLDKLNNIKIGKKKLPNKKKQLITLKNLTTLEKKLCYLMLITIQNKMKLREKDLKY